MHPGVEPAPANTNSGPKNGQITSFMRPKQNWTKEGLLEHIIELVVSEDEVNAYIYLPLITMLIILGLVHRRHKIYRQHSHQSPPPLSGNQSQPLSVFKTTGRHLQRPLSLHR